MDIFYDPLSPRCKSTTGAIEEEKNIGFFIKAVGSEKGVMSFIRDDDGKTFSFSGEKVPDGFSFRLEGFESGLYFYRFYIDGFKVGKNCFGFGEAGEDKEDFQLLVYKKGFSVPENFKGSVMYQIFPDRFSRAEGCGNAEGKRLRNDWGGTPEYLPNENGKIKNDDFFGGNFKGIERQAEYLKSLGVDYVYLNPIAKAYSNHRYDTGDYMRFDPLLGSDEDFSSLVKTFKKYDISLIFDGVYNHTGDDSLYFNKYGNYPELGAYQSKDSKYFGWYTFQDFPDKYTSWWGIDVLPTINKNAKSFEDFIACDGGVLDRYMSFGVKGVRLDVVDEISDEFVEKINRKIKSYGDDNVVIGEVWEDATNKVAYGKRRKYFRGGELDSVMNYPLKNAIIDYALSGNANNLYKLVREQIDNYPENALNMLMNILGTHDTPRILTVLGKRGILADDRSEMATEKLTEEEKNRAIKMLECCSLLQFCLYGVPCIYYGDEQMTEGNKDPFNRTCFSINENTELYERYKFLSSLRHKHKHFKNGRTGDLTADGGLFSFSRECENTKIYFAVNMGDMPMALSFDCRVYEITRDVKLSKILLKTYDFAIFYKVVENV